jgi:phosphoglycolate phosphatase-like HAD superfamily hydrolase
LGAEIKLRHFQLWDFFELGAFGDDHENRDSLASVALSRGRQIIDESLKGEDILVIGDTPLDVQCAKSIGAKSLAVATGGATMEQLEASNPTLLVPNLNSITVEEICQL